MFTTDYAQGWFKWDYISNGRWRGPSDQLGYQAGSSVITY